MAITISGENNNDRILAQDGVIDQISGINIVGLITSSHINVGSNIQLGNAGIITATTFVGNLTGNVNNTSPLLLQTGGSERFRITGNNELGIAGANYGSSGQVLTSGGSGSAVSWTTIPTQVTIANNADNRVITGGSGVNLNGEANLVFDGSSLGVGTNNPSNALDVQAGTTNTAIVARSTDAKAQISLLDNSTTSVGSVVIGAEGDDLFLTSGSGGAEALRITSDGRVLIGRTSAYAHADADNLIVGNEATNEHQGITILSHSGKYGGIYFGDGAGTNPNNRCKIIYDHPNDQLRIGTGGAAATQFYINSSGYVGVNVSPSARLDVKQDNAVAYNNRAQSVTYGAARFLNTSGHQSGGTYTGFQFNLTGNSQNRICAIGAISEASNSRNSSLVFATDDNGNRTEKLRITSDGRLLMGVTASQQGDANLQVFRAATTSRITFGNINTSASGIAGIDFCPSNKVMGSRIECQASEDFSTTANRTADLVFFTRQDGSSTEKVRIKGSGHVQLPINGQQLTFGSSQQIKFYYESSEDRMYLQGDGAYGFAFRVNSGNAIEIDKTTRDVTMQGASGRNFLWDNSEPSLYLTDNGGSSARLKIGTGGDLQMYHDAGNNVNYITAATNGEIKTSANSFTFYDYTGVTKRAVIDSNGLRIGTASAPTLPTTGVQPMIMRSATYFTKEVHRTISDYRSICDGAHSGYLLLIPAYPGSGTTTARKFYGTIICDRGGTGSGNSTQVAQVHAAVAYNDDQFYVENARSTQYIVSPAKVTYNGTAYLALKFGQSGGGPHNGIHIDGQYLGVDSNFLKLVRTNEVDSVQNDSHGAIANNNASFPLCGVMVVDMDGTPLNDNSIRYMRGGTVHFEYSPAGTDCYNNGIFTARVNGIYHVTAGVLTGSNSNRVEFSIQRQVSGGSYQNVVNFNGAANFSNSHNGPTATAFIKMKAGWNLRVYRVSSNQGAYGSTHGNNYFGAVLIHGLMDSQV